MIFTHFKLCLARDLQLNAFTSGTVFIRQNLTSFLTYKDSHGTEIIEIFLMAVDSYHMHSNEAERAN